MDVAELPQALAALARDLEQRDDDPFTLRSREAVLLAIATIKRLETEREEDAEEDAEARASLVSQIEELEDKLVSKGAADRLCELIGADASATSDDLVHDAAVWIETAKATIARERRGDPECMTGS